MDMLFARAMELNTPFQHVQNIPSCRFKFNFTNAQELLEGKCPVMFDIFTGNSPDVIISELETNLTSILNDTKMKKVECVVNAGNEDCIKECDRLFTEYINKVQTVTDVAVTNSAYDKYQLARNRLNNCTFIAYEDKYKHIIDHGDERKLWSEINWSGRHNETISQQIPIQVMSDYLDACINRWT